MVNDRSAESGDLHAAVCQAVTLMNMEIFQTDELRQAHNILRQALVDYADAKEQPQ